MRDAGQAVLEYLLLMAIATLLLGQFVSSASSETQDKFGNLAHILAFNLSSGTCDQDCFFGGYKNRHNE